jgi:hypothetical protein
MGPTNSLTSSFQSTLPNRRRHQAPATSAKSSTISSIFNFDIPANYAGQTCSLIFLFPLQSQLQTSSFTFSGSGGIDFSLLNGVATTATSYSNAPGVATDYGTKVVAPGNSYTIATFACPAGTTVSFEMKAMLGVLPGLQSKPNWFVYHHVLERRYYISGQMAVKIVRPYFVGQGFA